MLNVPWGTGKKAMQPMILLLWLTSCAPFAIPVEEYKHKSEAEIARMTAAQRVHQYADEQARHKHDVLDGHIQLIGKYIRRDGVKALPHIIEIMGEYDPTRTSGRTEHKGERFDAMWMLLGELDNHVVRLRASEEGRRAIDALERAISRMREAGYGQENQQEWEQHGRFNLAMMALEEAKGINSTDRALKDTFRLKYDILLSDVELLEFGNFLVARYSEYPGWSETNYFKDYTQRNEAGNPLWVYTMKEPERFHKAYSEFKKTKR